MSDKRGKREASVDVHTLIHLLPKLTMGKKDEIPSENYIRQMYTQGRTEFNNEKQRVKEDQAIKKTQAKAAAQKEMVREVRERIAQRSKQRIPKKFGKKLLNKVRGLENNDLFCHHRFPPKRKWVLETLTKNNGTSLNKKTNLALLYMFMSGDDGVRKQLLPKPYEHVQWSNKNYSNLKRRYFQNIVSSLSEQGFTYDQIQSMTQSGRTTKRKNMGSQNGDTWDAYNREVRRRMG